MTEIWKDAHTYMLSCCCPNGSFRGSHNIAIGTQAIDLRTDRSFARRILLPKAQLERRSLLDAVVNSAGVELRFPAALPAAREESFKKIARRYD
jgi:hypothetical protein